VTPRKHLILPLCPVTVKMLNQALKRAEIHGFLSRKTGATANHREIKIKAPAARR
jgi:DNA-binding HxlR family transcriptional regulator